MTKDTSSLTKVTAPAAARSGLYAVPSYCPVTEGQHTCYAGGSWLTAAVPMENPYCSTATPVWAVAYTCNSY